MRYKYVPIKSTDNIQEIMKQYNVSLDVLVQLNKFQYPEMLNNPFMVFEGYLLMVPVITPGNSLAERYR